MAVPLEIGVFAFSLNGLEWTKRKLLFIYVLKFLSGDDGRNISQTLWFRLHSSRSYSRWNILSNFLCVVDCVCVCVPVSVLFFGFTFFLFFFSLSRVAFDVPFLSRSGERRSLSDMIVRLSSERQQVDQSGLLSFRSDFGGTSTAFQQQHKREPHHLTNPNDFLFFYLYANGLE